MYVKLVLSQMRNIWVEYITSNVKKQNAFKAEKDVNSFEWLSFRLQFTLQKMQYPPISKAVSYPS